MTNQIEVYHGSPEFVEEKVNEFMERYTRENNGALPYVSNLAVDNGMVYVLVTYMKPIEGESK